MFLKKALSFCFLISKRTLLRDFATQIYIVRSLKRHPESGTSSEQDFLFFDPQKSTLYEKLKVLFLLHLCQVSILLPTLLFAGKEEYSLNKFVDQKIKTKQELLKSETIPSRVDAVTVSRLN